MLLPQMSMMQFLEEDRAVIPTATRRLVMDRPLPHMLAANGMLDLGLGIQRRTGRAS
jgi:hypothetical protein